MSNQGPLGSLANTPLVDQTLGSCRHLASVSAYYQSDQDGHDNQSEQSHADHELQTHPDRWVGALERASCHVEGIERPQLPVGRDDPAEPRRGHTDAESAAVEVLGGQVRDRH